MSSLPVDPPADDDEHLALQRRIMTAKMLGLETAVPARDVMVTRVDRRVYLGVKGSGFVRLRWGEAHALAQALEQLADAIAGDDIG